MGNFSSDTALTYSHGFLFVNVPLLVKDYGETVMKIKKMIKPASILDLPVAISGDILVKVTGERLESNGKKFRVNPVFP